MCLAQGHNPVAPVRLEPATPWLPVKHSTAELPPSLLYQTRRKNPFVHKRVNFLTGLQLRVRNENSIFLFLSQNICCGYSKEPSQ